MADILFELGCEELPPKALYGLSKALFDGVCKQLTEQGFAFAEDSRWYASPRRLAFILRDASEQLEDSTTEKRGPAVAAAFDDEGNAKPAAMGFARSVGVDVSDLQKVMTDKGEYLSYQVTEKGQHINDVLPAVITQAIKQLPIPKPMRWGNNDFAFIRPVHWMVLMNGETVLNMNLFDVQSGQQTRGHRFHNNTWVKIPTVLDYVSVLQEAQIMVDHLEREALITQQVNDAAESVNGTALIGSALLQEVASITEKPVAVLGDFSTDFLSVPREALISSMEKHQKYFAIENSEGQLMPHFIALANIDSKNPAAVKKGFEKVITPRLADARFFWEKDKARPLSDNTPLLEKMVFEKTLGTIADKTVRIAKLLNWLAPQMNFDAAEGDRAAELLKSDLMSDMVDEFPDLQGLMGGYYAAAQGESVDVAKAIRDQYLPKFVGDALPEIALGQAVSMADKMDTLCGIFAVGKKPSGSKDPFALRRAALSVLAILQQKAINVSVPEMVKQMMSFMPVEDTADAEETVNQFIQQRLKQQYKDNGIAYDVVEAVLATDSDNLPDIDARIEACQSFKKAAEAGSLIESNKRINNILAKAEITEASAIDVGLFEADQEKALFAALSEVQDQVAPLFDQKAYSQCLQQMASLAEPVAEFFEHVMVNADNEAVKNNRLALLQAMQSLFNQVAQISLLVK
ncbi:glycine--tRNA ligase subunit beta [Marinicella rhabdoformis]|uniref:glycine--tRNA ligase subunit beta n=1 Tax=Marinicella rhabdoformis TaxID=2580566 RepID=UPI0012AECF46|nr:glycine--tRNA ligase subunit beta [Marinicella rhabdoformis]